MKENNNSVKLFNEKAQSANTWYNKNKYYNRDIEKLVISYLGEIFTIPYALPIKYKDPL